MWTDESRPKYERRGLRYPSDLTDEEWALIEPLLPLGHERSPHEPPATAVAVRESRGLPLEIVKGSDAKGFKVLPKRWIVERTFSWIDAVGASPGISKT